jgi:hypothetical protein
MNDEYPVALSIDYPDRALNRLSSALRIFAFIPIAIVLGAIGGYSAQWGTNTGGRASTIVVGGTGLLFLPPLLRPSSGKSTRAGGSTGTSNSCASPTV